jgi:hypothetical protein
VLSCTHAAALRWSCTLALVKVSSTFKACTTPHVISLRKSMMPFSSARVFLPMLLLASVLMAPCLAEKRDTALDWKWHKSRATYYGEALPGPQALQLSCLHRSKRCVRRAQHCW